MRLIIDELTSLTDDLAALEPWTLTSAQVREAAVVVQRARAALDAALSRLAGYADMMGLPVDDGATSTTAWLANMTGMTKTDASTLVALAKVTTADTETTRAAWAAGRLSTDQVLVIMKAVDGLSEWCGEVERGDAEAHLIALAAEHPLDDLKRLANYVLGVIDPDGADQLLGDKLRAEEERAWDATRLSMRRRGDGTTRGAFTIPDTDADTLRAAIEGIIAPRRSASNAERLDLSVDDYKNLPRDQKMGHAFTELIDHLPTEALPQAGGLAATVAVTIDVDDLRTGQGVATNTSGTAMSAAKAQRLACNAHLVALYLDSESRVLDHGMTKRIYDRHQRLVLAVRDGGCVWPGCDKTSRVVRGAPPQLLVRERAHRSGQCGPAVPLPPLPRPRRRMGSEDGQRRHRRDHPASTRRSGPKAPPPQQIHPTSTPRRLSRRRVRRHRWAWLRLTTGSGDLLAHPDEAR